MDGRQIKKSFYTVAFTLAVTTFFIAGLSFAYSSTKERIKLNEKLSLRRAVLAAARVEMPGDPVKISDLFEAIVEEKTSKEVHYYKVTKENGESSYVFDVSGPGLWGTIYALLGYDSGFTSIQGFVIMDQNETPGLGGRIAEAWFQDQFSGKMGPFDKLVPEESPSDSTSFAAVTGATSSSNAVKELLNRAIAGQVEAVKKEVLP